MSDFFKEEFRDLSKNNAAGFTDAEIITAIKSGNTGLFVELLKRHEEYLRYLVSKAVNRAPGYAAGDASKDTEDLVSEITIKIFSSLDSYNHERAEFRTWITRIAENHITDWLKKRRLNLHPFSWGGTDGEDGGELPVESGKEDSPSPVAKYLVEVAVNDILTALLEIKNSLLRSHLIFRFVFTLDDGEIAQIFGVSESTVRANVCRALKEFGDTFTKLFPQYACCADMSAVTDFIRNGAVEIPPELLDEKSNSSVSKLRAALSSCDPSFYVIKSAASELHGLTRAALEEVLTARKTRSTGKIMWKKETEISEAAASQVSRYINMLLSERNIPDGTRSLKSRPPLLRLRQSAMAITIALAYLSVKKHFSMSLGTIILDKARDKKISPDQLGKILKLNPVRLSNLLNNNIDESMRKDKKLIERISAFTKIPAKDIEIYASVAIPPPHSPTGIALTTHLRDASVPSARKRTLEIIRKILDSRYGAVK